MKIFVFDNIENTLKIDEYSILLIKEFKDLWDVARNKCKEDKTGKKRLKAYREFTYIFLMKDFKSPYFSYMEGDRHEAAKIDSGISESELKDPLFKAAINKYSEIQNSDPVLSVIEAGQRTLYKMQIFLDSIDFNNDVDADGRPLYKPKDVLADLQALDKMRTQLEELKLKHMKGLTATDSKIRGDATPGYRD